MAKQHVHRGGELSIDNSTDLYGQVTSITLPTIEEKTDDMQIGGMNFEADVALGFNKLEAEIHLTKLNPVYLTKIGVSVGQRVPFRWMASLDNSDSDTPTGLNALMRGRITSIDLGEQKSSEKADVTIKISIDEQYLLRIANEVIYDIQPLRLIHRVGENDLMQVHRQNMGYDY
ncbi:MAG: hypothetical protein COA90_00865 [Gammaproteobacteria bacterium]|nr:MAG: hypothetical protein COA90_00865 [Gammaproteobacteria bacterium]